MQTARERVRLIGWSLSRVELLIGWSPPEDLDKWQPLPQLPFPSPASCGHVLGPRGTKYDRKHVDPIFQTGALSMDSNQGAIGAPSAGTDSNCSHMLIMEHPLNHSNFSTP